ncbi:MAG: hypothetical protein U0M63_01110 [Alistipes onderdonkii]|jgi:hypothetical protein|uniref:hypothetical protein n=1 Tax=Alistipes onderdonkii TaxID=328813 RepID=UPI00206A9766|nr:hypothetical protein [Alistipes onderdonkii]MEE0848252.1 hypothetical protein [Alistipes onderdonkii]DAE34966.1 MAG TPA: hypothetical protein [Caudoviricetes sp.]DAG10344.1 MAG TPA: hypothetical protein [Caudoviricetes sp.]
MKRKLTLTDIAGYLAYPLLGQHPTGAICWIDVEFMSRLGLSLAGYKPVLRPMSDLCKEITDKDYNDGKPFIPSDHLKELLDGDFEDCLILDCRIKYSPSEFWYSDMSAILDMFHQLKFDYRGLIDAGLAISVHDLKQNPYEK